MHGLSQGAFTAAQKGDFQDGFLGAFVSKLAMSLAFETPGMRQILGQPGDESLKIIPRTIVAALVGGTAAKLGGGKFGSGAVSAAISWVFNGETPEGASDQERVDREMREGSAVRVLRVRVGSEVHEEDRGFPSELVYSDVVKLRRVVPITEIESLPSGLGMVARTAAGRFFPGPLGTEKWKPKLSRWGRNALAKNAIFMHETGFYLQIVAYRETLVTTTPIFRDIWLHPYTGRFSVSDVVGSPIQRILHTREIFYVRIGAAPGIH